VHTPAYTYAYSCAPFRTQVVLVRGCKRARGAVWHRSGPLQLWGTAQTQLASHSCAGGGGGGTVSMAPAPPAGAVCTRSELEVISTAANPSDAVTALMGKNTPCGQCIVKCGSAANRSSCAMACVSGGPGPSTPVVCPSTPGVCPAGKCDASTPWYSYKSCNCYPTQLKTYYIYCGSARSNGQTPSGPAPPPTAAPATPAPS
jgi:hypothetical protein